MGGMRKRNLTAGAVLIVLGVVFAYLTSQLPTRAIENATQPSFFPWVITACLWRPFLPQNSPGPRVNTSARYARDTMGG